MSDPFTVLGGGHVTDFTFLRMLGDRFGFECHARGSFPLAARRTVGGLSIRSFRDPDELKDAIRRTKPDALYSSLFVSPLCVRLAQRFNIPHVVYVHSFELCPPRGAEIRRWKMAEEWSPIDADSARLVLDGADVVVANSRFMQRRLLKVHGVKSVVIEPEIDPRDVLIPAAGRDERRYITSVCGHGSKGADVVLELARHLPAEQFLVTGHLHRQYRPRFEAAPNVTLWPFGPPRKFLAATRILLVPSQWAEPFGRMAVEGMANGIPTLASLTGGLVEIVRDSSIGVSRFNQVDAWDMALKALLQSEERRQRNGVEGRRLAARFLRGLSTAKLAALIERAVRRRRPVAKAPTVVALRGADNLKTCFSMINRHWARGLDGRITIRPLPFDASMTLSESVDATVMHDFSHDFKTWQLPDEGKLIAARTWDFGPYPRSWVDLINAHYDRLWVFSRWIKQQAIRGGVPPNRVTMVSHGVDGAIFKPEGRRYPLDTGDSFKFLFVGALVLRKGIDILLDAYCAAFNPTDPVCLVIKSNPEDVIYRGIDPADRDRIVSLAQDSSCPPIRLIDRFLSEPELAALYRSCDVGVFPYRAEGFCVPILEAMACGTPSIVPRFGACLDFCSAATSFLIPARRIRLPVGRSMAINSLGFREEVTETDFCEIEVDALRDALRAVAFGSAAVRGTKARRGVAVAHGRFRGRRSPRG